MSIKSQYTVKNGDRISYIAINYKITVEEIVKVNPQIFTPERLAKTNELIGDGTLNPGEMLIYSGEVLNIPTGFLDDLSEEQTMKVDSEDELTIQIDRKKCPLPHTFRFTEYFDTCSDSFDMTYPYDSDLQNPAYQVDPNNFKTKGLPDIKIFIGEDPVLVGKIEVPANKITPSSSSQTLAGRSKTFILEKSDMLPTIRREFLDQDLKQIAEIVCNSYSIPLEISPDVVIGESFPKVTAGDTEKPYFFLARLARERSAIVTKTGTGKCLITKAIDSEPVANFNIDGTFLEFLGVQALEFSFDTTSIFGSYIGKATTPDDQNLTETVESKTLLQNSVKITSYQDADDKTLKGMTVWEEQKIIREFYKNSIPYPDWLNPNTGKRWKTGQYITIQAADALIKNPVIMLIRQIDFTIGTGNSRTATLNLIPKGVYL